MYRMFPPNWQSQAKTALFCARNLTICEQMLTFYADLDPSVDNFDREATYKTHSPSGAGWKTFDHYA